MEPGADYLRIAIRLADEGVPLRAIARATGVLSTKLYETLTDARMDGRLLGLPRDDWPAGCPRDQRALQLSRLAIENRDALTLAIQEIFKLPPTGARLLLRLVQHEVVPHARLDINRGSLMVHIYTLRHRLKPHGIEIKTLWGYGYQLSTADRRQAMDLILQRAMPQTVDPA
jgi:DNA-binding response OmpR family regulator